MAIASFSGLSELIAPPSWGVTDSLPHLVVGADVLAVPVLTGGADTSVLLGPGADEIGVEIGIDLLAAAESLDHIGRPGQVVRLPAGSERTVLLIGVGEGTRDQLRRAGAALGRATRGCALLATTVPDVADPEALPAFVAGLDLAGFEFRMPGTEPERRPVTRVMLAGVPVAAQPETETVLGRATAVSAASWTARLLATVPSNVKNPPWLADQAVILAEQAGLEVEVWDEERLAAEGFGGVLAVGAGSVTPPRFIRLVHTPTDATRRTPTVVLVGKGITFDSGGLSIKPGESMSTMKRDMTGAAVVLGVMGALAAVNCPVRVVGLIPAAENSVGADSMRPGDVITQFGGRTTEVTNTDAEGRLVLADALQWAVDHEKPTVLVDIATLTGAMKVALGLHTGGFFANDETLAERIAEAGRASGEPVWRLPLAAQYEEKLSSKIADADNAPGGPGAITAALFLQHYTGGLPWVHLDVASVGDVPTDRDEWTAGPSGFGARLLLDWLGSTDPLEGVNR